MFTETELSRSQAQEERLRNLCIVYQMGKVGSRSIYGTLQKVFQSIFFAHHLNPQSLLSERFEIFRHYPIQTWLGNGFKKNFFQYIQNKNTSDIVFKRLKKNKRWTVITSVREPVARNLSFFFQRIDRRFYRFYDQIQKNKISDQKIIDLFFKKMNHAEGVEWFDREMKQVFDVDVYSEPFRHSKGYQIFSSNKADVLVFKLESLDASFERGMREFLGAANLTLLKENSAEEKPYFSVYQQIKQSIKFPAAYLDTMYDSRFTHHFYTDEEIKLFRKKWNRG